MRHQVNLLSRDRCQTGTFQGNHATMHDENRASLWATRDQGHMMPGQAVSGVCVRHHKWLDEDAEHWNIDNFFYMHIT